MKRTGSVVASLFRRTLQLDVTLNSISQRYKGGEGRRSEFRSKVSKNAVFKKIFRSEVSAVAKNPFRGVEMIKPEKGQSKRFSKCEISRSEVGKEGSKNVSRSEVSFTSPNRRIYYEYIRSGYAHERVPISYHCR